MTALTVPSLEQAQKDLEFVDLVDGFYCSNMSSHAGNQLIRFANLEYLADYLESRTFEEHKANGFRGELHYANLSALADWIEMHYGDAELVAGIRELVALDEPFGIVSPKVKSLMQVRLQQCREVIGASSDAAQKVETGANA